MKKKILACLGVMSIVAVMVIVVRNSYSGNTDIWALGGQGAVNNKDMLRLDSNYDLRLYYGDLYFGDVGTAPSTSAGGYYGVKVPCYNVGPAITAGMVVVSSNTGTGYCRSSEASGSTSVIGVAEGAIASGAVGYITVAGYATVLTTGTVAIGSVVVSSASAVGYGGGTTTPTTGTDLGVAMSAGTAAGGLTLIRLR